MLIAGWRTASGVLAVGAIGVIGGSLIGTAATILGGGREQVTLPAAELFIVVPTLIWALTAADCPSTRCASELKRARRGRRRRGRAQCRPSRATDRKSMFYEYRMFMFDDPMLMIWPGLAIAAVTLALNLGLDRR